MTAHTSPADTQQPSQSPALAYLIYRCCERLHISEQAFWNADYSQQIDLLAFELMRQHEERGR